MIQFEKDIEDSEIRIIGTPPAPIPEQPPKTNRNKKRWLIFMGIFIIIIIITGIIISKISSYRESKLYVEEPSYFEPLYESEPLIMEQQIEQYKDSATFGYTEIRDTIINDIPIRLYIPHHADMTLHLGRINRQDTTIIYAAQAADVRADNGGIVGAFVLKGEPKAWDCPRRGSAPLSMARSLWV